MSTVGIGRPKRRNNGHHSDSVADANFQEPIQRPGGIPRGRAEGDTALVRQALLLQLALKALDRVIADYCGGGNRRRPSYTALARYLDERERALRPAPSRIAGVPR